MRGRYVAILVLCSVVALNAQTPKPTFEVASVKRNLSGSLSSSVSPRPGGIYNATNTALSSFIQFAYSVEDYQLIGRPSWVQTDRFDIAARAGREVPTIELRQMVQSLLEDRFKLVTHREQREMSIYMLVLARSDGRLGSGFQRVDDCKEAKSRGPEDSPSGARRSNGCGSLSLVASMASWTLGAPVVDKTGVSGLFDVFIYYSPEGLRQLGGTVLASPDRPLPDPSLPSYPAALQEQLGLKLESTRGPVDVLVIDSVQQPTEN